MLWYHTVSRLIATFLNKIWGHEDEDAFSDQIGVISCSRVKLNYIFNCDHLMPGQHHSTALWSEASPWQDNEYFIQLFCFAKNILREWSTLLSAYKVHVLSAIMTGLFVLLYLKRREKRIDKRVKVAARWGKKELSSKKLSSEQSENGDEKK